MTDWPTKETVVEFEHELVGFKLSLLLFPDDISDIGDLDLSHTYLPAVQSIHALKQCVV